ncbi:unnamed protein product [Onchocerca ochengi]|uniref:ZP domain-containing protein n=1 Tax=Onchocerca ochengi TaxID=42157 RepID=A0A182DXF0_ONCOC|nr:unnamed protein product [Onchocerca ochengi]
MTDLDCPTLDDSVAIFSLSCWIQINSTKKGRKIERICMEAQSTTIETVTVIRPLKVDPHLIFHNNNYANTLQHKLLPKSQVIALMCLFVAFILLILCLSTTWWLRSGGFRTGLWLECTSSDLTQSTIAGGPPPGRCQKVHRNAGKFPSI